MAKLNLEKLLKTDFIDRFLGFLEKYDEVRDTYIYHRAQKWINEKNFDSIRYFLNTTPIETSLPISLNQFVSMNYEDVVIDVWCYIHSSVVY